MRARWPLLSLATCALALTAASASAQTPDKKSIGAAPSGEVRKDPAGVTGISPYMEAIAKGERAFVARDFPGAVEAFQDAIKLDGQQMLGFYRLGEVQLANAKVDEADATWQAGLTKKGKPELHARLLLCLSDLRERQGKWQEAKDAWGQYLAFLESSKAFGYPATGIERQKQIDRRVKDEKDYGVVKARIAARQAEVEKEALENAKKDKLNR